MVFALASARAECSMACSYGCWDLKTLSFKVSTRYSSNSFLSFSNSAPFLPKENSGL